jgi:pimeloyl-ACP methyl ester carboxylesterase
MLIADLFKVAIYCVGLKLWGMNHYEDVSCKNNTLMKNIFTTSLLLTTILIAVSAKVNAQTDPLEAFKIDSGYHTSFDGTKIYYEVRGKGKPVVLVHGFMNNGDNWKRSVLYSDLLLHGYQVITLDQRGNGKSDKPHNEEAYTNDAEAKDILSLLKSLNIGKYKAIGYSRGSIITARLLVLDKNLTAAVLGGMGDGFTNPQWPRRLMFYRALSGENVPELQTAMENVKKSGLDRTALTYQQKYQPSTPPSELKKLKQPVLVISGSEDNDNGSAEELAKMIPKSTVLRVPGVHNNTSRTQPFADAVVSFLEKK